MSQRFDGDRQVMYVDHFGNLVTNISAEALRRFSGHRLFR